MKTSDGVFCWCFANALGATQSTFCLNNSQSAHPMPAHTSAADRQIQIRIKREDGVEKRATPAAVAGGLRGFACFACTPFIFFNISFISFTLYKRTCTLHTHVHTHTHTHVFCQHFREMGSHENWERETEIKIGVWQAKEKTLPDPPPPAPPPPPPLHVAAGRVARPIAAPTCAEGGVRKRTVEGREMRPTFLVPRLAPAVAATDAAVNVSAGVAILF